jgi:hypothetical protein
MHSSTGTRSSVPHPARTALIEVLIVVALLAIGYLVLAQELAPTLPPAETVTTLG